MSELLMAAAQLSMAAYFHLNSNYLQKSSDNYNGNFYSTTESSFAVAPAANASDDNETTPATTTTESAELLELPTPVVPLWLPLPILMLFTAAFNVGMGSLTWTVATEMLPVRSKRWTHTVSNATSNLWWFVVTKTFKDIYELASPATPFLVYGCVCVFGFFFILIFLPETRERPSDEIASAFQRQRNCCLCACCWKRCCRHSTCCQRRRSRRHRRSNHRDGPTNEESLNLDVEPLASPSAPDVEIEENNEICDHKKQEKAALRRKSKFRDGLTLTPNGQTAGAGNHELQMLNNSVTVTAATPSPT